MNNLDAIIQKEFPTVIMPRYEEPPLLQFGKTRLLMGKEGLYIDTMQPYGQLRKLVWKSPRPLPYGEVREIDGFKVVLELCMKKIISTKMLPAAAEFARHNKEWVGHILFDKNSGFYYLPAGMISEEYRVTYNRNVQKGECIAVDVHSHHRMKPFFSAEDNQDDSGGVRISVVLGNFRPSLDMFEWIARYAVEGFFFEYGGERETLFA